MDFPGGNRAYFEGVTCINRRHEALPTLRVSSNLLCVAAGRQAQIVDNLSHRVAGLLKASAPAGCSFKTSSCAFNIRHLVLHIHMRRVEKEQNLFEPFPSAWHRYWIHRHDADLRRLCWWHDRPVRRAAHDGPIGSAAHRRHPRHPKPLLKRQERRRRNGRQGNLDRRFPGRSAQIPSCRCGFRRHLRLNPLANGIQAGNPSTDRHQQIVRGGAAIHAHYKSCPFRRLVGFCHALEGYSCKEH